MIFCHLEKEVTFIETTELAVANCQPKGPALYGINAKRSLQPDISTLSECFSKAGQVGVVVCCLAIDIGPWFESHWGHYVEWVFSPNLTAQVLPSNNGSWLV